MKTMIEEKPRLIRFLDGEFKNRTLRKPYRMWWRNFMYSTVMIVATLLLFLFIQILSNIADHINYVVR